MTWLVLFRMECDHTDQVPFATLYERMTCPECNRKRKVKAVETREWFFKCGQCRYGRFTGQSKVDAEALLGIHHIKTHHVGGSVWYRKHPQKVQAIRQLFAHKRMRDVITSERKLYPDEYLSKAHIRRSVDEIPLPGDDKPPF